MENKFSNSGVERNVNSVENVSVQTKSTKRRSRNNSPYLRIRMKANNIFKTQLSRTNETKRETIEIALAKLGTPEYSKDVFLSEFKKQTELLLDSRRFEADCKKLQLDPLAVATHVVYDGSTKVDAVLKNGVEHEYYGRYKELKEPLYTLEELDSATFVVVPNGDSQNTTED